VGTMHTDLHGMFHGGQRNIIKAHATCLCLIAPAFHAARHCVLDVASRAHSTVLLAS